MNEPQDKSAIALGPRHLHKVVVLFLDLARKMPWWLSLLNRLFLWIAHQDKSVREIRANAKIKTAS